MKNLKLFLLLLIPALFVFTGCGEDDEDKDLSPTINFLGGSQFVSDDVTVEPGDTIIVGINSSENSISGSKLNNFKVERQLTGQNSPAVVVDSSINESTFNFTGGFIASTSENVETFTFTVTDKNGEFASVSFVVTTEGATTALGSAQSFTWERCGSTPGTGLSTFGLKWESNTGTSAIITEDADKLVILTAAEWTSITTQEGLADAVDNGTGVTQYSDVSSQASASYDDVLATKNGSNYYLIHVTNGVVTTPACGTKIVITGEYKE
ncbi:MAG: hypothetical protein WD048_04805 [Chitinophagales bacterium]